MLDERGHSADARVRYVRLERNLGGAGGFHHGFAEACAAGFDWIWAMDDDTIVTRDVLERLFTARASFQSNPPDVLSSRVVWTDGTPHPMNRAWLRDRKGEVDPTEGPVPIRAATFVAFLLHRRCIQKFGLPIADYFIWSDDIEYSARILRTECGVLVPDSVAVHKTAEKHGPLGAQPERFYFHVRNTLWMLLRSNAWSWAEALPQLLSLMLVIQATVRRAASKRAVTRATLRALRDGLLTRPRR
jgi:GT2 family glycosyltransferase